MAKINHAASANDLTKETLKALTLKGFHVWRQNNVGVYDAKIKAYRANSATKGIPDIIGFHKKTGRFVCAEIKVGKDKLSKEQIAFMDAAGAANCWYFLVKSMSDIEWIYGLDF
jgi:Holliday junction resolvase